MPVRLTLIACWWLAVLWGYSFAFSRAFDDCKNAIFYSGAGLFILATLLQRWRNGLHAPQGRLTRAAIVLYGIAVVFSLLRLRMSHQAAAVDIAQLFLWMGCIWGFLHTPLATLRTLMHLSVGAAVAIVALTVLHRMGWSPLTQPRNAIFLPPLGHVNYYAEIIALHVPLACYLAVNARHRLQQSFHWIALPILLYGTLQTGTRATCLGLLGAALGIGMLLQQHLRRTRMIALLSITLLISGALVVTLGQTRTVNVAQRLEQTLSALWRGNMDETFSSRGAIWINTLAMIRDHPLQGSGAGNFRFAYREYAHRHANDTESRRSQWQMHPHNVFLRQAAELGLFAIIALLLLAWGGGHTLWKLWQNPAHHRWRPSVCIGISGLIIAGISWQFGTNSTFPMSRLMVALYVAILWQAVQHTRTLPRDTPGRTPVRSLLAITIVLMALTMVCGHTASLLLNKQASHTLPPDTTLRLAQRSDRLAPGNFDALFTITHAAGKTGQRALASHTADRMLRNFPEVPSMLYLVAKVRLMAGDVQAAEQLLKHAVRNDPHFSPAQELLAQLTATHSSP